MFLSATQLACTIINISYWVNLCNGAPLLHRPRRPSDYSSTSSRAPRFTVPLVIRDNVNSTSRNVTSSLTSTIRDDVQSMLQLIGPDAESRFVNLNTPTAFGANDPVQSNQDLSQLVDRAFLPGQVKSGNSGWVNTYVQCLIDVANTLPGLDNQTALIDGYFNAMRALAPAQAKLVDAYKVAKNESTTNIGVQLSSGRLIDALTMETVDEWATSAFNGNGSEESHSGFDSKDYKNYLNLNASYTSFLAKYNKLETANKIASEGWLLREMINRSPAIFNLSMITAGDPSSTSAQYSPAWSATIINTTSVAVSNIGQNLNDGFRDGTTNSTTYATSINSEAPVTTSVSFSSTAGSNSASPSPIPSNVESNSGKIPQSPTLTSTMSPTVTATGSARRSRFRRSRILPRSHFQRRALAASNALLLAASAGGSSSSETTPAHVNTPGIKDASFSGMDQVASAADSVSEADIENVSFAPLSSTTTQTSFLSSTTSVTGFPSKNASDPLSGIPDIPLQTTASLFAMSLQEGAWSNNRADFLQFIAQYHPDIYQKYFGNGTTGDGSLGKHWTHIFLLVTVKANSTEIETSEVVGMVYNVLPGLTTPRTSVDANSSRLDVGSTGVAGSTNQTLDDNSNMNSTDTSSGKITSGLGRRSIRR
ncbi:hypothetical protein DFJ43DRAFT_1159373 [Lentinula guzmanii]|uniref:Uncharacterized protein n=1 Tax=Lentinula guzmanii TaxID=2804957 RepID=A0AA38JFC2_9AGAR|nr:hypothetical protein DFJ43DRAFT_1159373 [Lentinula guzmanii]